MRIRVLIWIAAVIFLGTVRSSEGSYITIETETKVTVEKNAAQVHIEVVNKGDEPAYNVRIGAEAAGRNEKGPLMDQLGQDEKAELDFKAPLSYEKPGKYPVVVTVDYTDLNRYPFTALSIAYVDYRERVVGRVVGELSVPPVTDRGTVRVKVKNLEQAKKSVAIRLVLPKEFINSQPARSLEIEPGREETAEFELSNISALQGSQYQIFALLEYEDDQYHYTNALTGTMEVVEKKTFVARYKKVLISLAAILAAAAVFWNIRKRWGSARPAP